MGEISLVKYLKKKSPDLQFEVQSFELNASTGLLILFPEEFLIKNLVHSKALPVNRLFNNDLNEPIIKLSDGNSSLRFLFQSIPWDTKQKKILEGKKFLGYFSIRSW